MGCAVIQLTIETKALLDKLNAIRAKGIKYAVSMAMTWTAKDASEAFAKEMQEKLDRPMPQTLKASRFKPATADKTEYDVYVQDQGSGLAPPSAYLQAEITGGYRKNKGIENLLRSRNILPPGWQVELGDDAPKDQYGNLTGGGGKYQQIALGLSAYTEERANAIQAARLKRNPNMAVSKKEYFVLYSLKTKTPTGVYTRKGKRGVAQLLKFTPKRAKYTQRLPFKETIQRTFTAVFDGNFKKGLEAMLEKVKSW